jgi:hypothetical protein
MTLKKSTKKRVTIKKGDVASAALGEPGAIPLLLYRKIALTFMFIVAAALLTVLYFSTVQAVIHIDSTQTPTTAEFITDVMKTPIEDGDVAGTVAVGIVGKTQTFTASGESKKKVEGIATGEVTITSNLSFPQQLVKKTRLLSKEGVLFHLTEGVVVPSGGSITASVYADEPGALGDSAPTTFTIPGLSAARQSEVTASSVSAFTGGESEIAVVSQEEIDSAFNSLEKVLIDEAVSVFRDKVGADYKGLSYSVERLQSEASIEAGTQAAQYDITLSIEVAAVFYDKDALEKVAVRKLYEKLGQGQVMAGVKSDELSVGVEAYDEALQKARVRIVLSGIVVNAQTNEALNVGRFVGMSEDAVRSLLINEGLAKNVDVEFFPFWVNKVPRLKDHIYVDIR